MTKKIVPVSILMSTYCGVKAGWLNDSLESICSPVVVPSELILVIDGPVAQDQHDVVDRILRKFNNINFKIIQIECQSGLANAMNTGLLVVTNDLVARMDADDLCCPDRIFLQYEFMSKHHNIDILSGWHSEFEKDAVIDRVKVTPELDIDIKCALEFRNVISHPTIMVRKSCYEATQGYNKNVGLLEDYDLYLRFRHLNFQFHALQVPLVFVRVLADQRRRRGGIAYVIGELRFRFLMFRDNRIGFLGLLVGIFVYPIFRMSPLVVKDFLYTLVRVRPI